MKIKTIQVIEADNGKMLTDGEIIASAVMLPECRDIEEFKEITLAEAEAIRAE